jgi:DNA-binding TFAR19-related protein (PDSD5 family)
MGDDELAEIRNRRMAELQAQMVKEKFKKKFRKNKTSKSLLYIFFL